ncbi:MAG: hypothetical protein AAGF23_11500 [Acidobacteriota bacterium]
MTIDLLPAVCMLFGALLLIGRTDRRHWPPTSGKESSRRALRLAGFSSLLGAVAGFSRSLGLEVGMAWFLRWFALAALAATVWLSLRPRSSAWAGGLLVAAAAGLWIL